MNVDAVSQGGWSELNERGGQVAPAFEILSGCAVELSGVLSWAAFFLGAGADQNSARPQCTFHPAHRLPRLPLPRSTDKPATTSFLLHRAHHFLHHPPLTRAQCLPTTASAIRAI